MEENEVKQVHHGDSEFNGFQSPEIVRVPASKRSCGYTSLKDLLQSPPASENSPGAMAAMMMMSSSPTASASWNEIPIRNPLVKHAAMAYLQPLSAQTTPFGSDKGLFAKLRDKCCCSSSSSDFGCVSWLCDAISTALRALFGYRRRDDDDDDDDDEDDDEYVIDGEKVD